ncbi:uncharacterized protein LOC129596445 [Paramacrobiotus metropolitanus]|uniref:uncharacterized protein LOC129596445 n=1 Tax=Paramacrobiotus metropolitanus TaxID=2943436 RepID=UPI0024461A37|nr:uncharacterized protein LOC129596445 [Paramacrobiotus metropolitanus]
MCLLRSHNSLSCAVGAGSTQNGVLRLRLFPVFGILMILYGVLPVISTDYGNQHRNNSFISRTRRSVGYENVVITVPSNPSHKPWEKVTPDQCISFLETSGLLTGQEGWCPGVTDDVLCWPTTAPGETILQPCPNMTGTDTTKFANKTCDMNGTWESKPDSGDAGYTYYDDCFNDDTKQMFETYYGGSAEAAIIRQKFEALHNQSQSNQGASDISHTSSSLNIQASNTSRSREFSKLPTPFICIFCTINL